jgi:hypothetical protein
MKSDARNIIIGFALIGLVALGGWILTLQKESKYYQTEYEREKRNHAKIIEDTKKEIENLKQKLSESERKSVALQENLDREISDLKMSLNSRNKQLSDYENRIKSCTETVEPQRSDSNEEYDALNDKFKACVDNNSVLSSELAVSQENYRDIYKTLEGILEELDNIDSERVSDEILDSKENPYSVIQEDLEKEIKKYGDDISFDILKKKKAIRYFSENIKNLNLIFTNIADDTLLVYDKGYKLFHAASVISQESENDLEDLLRSGSHVYGVRVNDLSLMEKQTVFDTLKNNTKSSPVLIDLVMQGEKGRDVHPDARLRFFRWGNNNAVQKTQNLVYFYEKSLGGSKDRLQGVIHVNKSPIFYVFSKDILRALRDATEPDDENTIYYRVKKGIFSRDFWMEHYHDIALEVSKLDMELVDVDYFIEGDDNQDAINKKLIGAIERSKNQRTNFAVDFSNKRAIRQITYLLGKS